jgi:hypothetical protein
VLPGLQVLSLQQPLGQLVGVHTQAPFWHSKPAGQLTQATPPVPQAALVLPGLQVLFSQQPLGQLAGVHTQEPFWHSVPAGQLTQVTPPVPHAWLVLPGLQLLFSQQPLGQLAGVQTHWPFTHVCPAAHALPHAPQWEVLVWRLTHSPTWGTAPVPVQTVGVLAGQTQRLPVEQLAPVGQHRLPHTRLFGQQNLSVPEVLSTRQV